LARAQQLTLPAPSKSSSTAFTNYDGLSGICDLAWWAEIGIRPWAVSIRRQRRWPNL
jgi:hypothetical protein